MKMSGLFTKVRSLPLHYPLIRGMISYSIIWPTCSIVQEYLEHGTTLEKANYARAARFGIFGSLFMAPVFYGWMKYSGRFFKKNNLRTAIFRAAIEQVTYSPLALAYFFFGMSLLERKPVRVCCNEVREKFWATYKIGMVFWPTAQTINYYFISDKNKIVFVSAASFIWTVYLAHMKGKEQKNLLDLPNPLTNSLINRSVIVEKNSLSKRDNIPFQEPLADAAGKSNMKPKLDSSLDTNPRNTVMSDTGPEKSGKPVKNDARHPNPIPKLFHETPVENDSESDKLTIRNPFNVIIDNPALPTTVGSSAKNESRNDITPAPSPIPIEPMNPIGNKMRASGEYPIPSVIIKNELRTDSAPVVLVKKDDDSDNDDNDSDDKNKQDTIKAKETSNSNDITVILGDTGVVEIPLGDEESLRIIEVIGAASKEEEADDEMPLTLEDN